MNSAGERALSFKCGDEQVLAILSGPAAAARRGVLIVVGGPQYRAGSHRQFTLLARHLAAQGVPALRFDYRGMGDSAGERRSFEQVEQDIGCAIDHFFAAVPALEHVVIWGLCDAASAALFYAHQDPRVSGLVLVNPWVRTEEGEARVYLRHYYLARLFQQDLWLKIGRGQFNLRETAASLGRYLKNALGPRASAPAGSTHPQRMEQGLRSFGGRVLLVLSGDDFTAQEFKDLVAASDSWRGLLGAERVTQRHLAEANHTFARRAWRDQVARWTEDWLKSF